MTRCAGYLAGAAFELVIVRQAPPTAKGVHFLALEDEDGLVTDG